MSENATLQLPKDLVEGAIKTQVATAIASALKDHGSVVESVIHKVLTMKVDRDGEKARGYSGDLEFIEWLCRNAIEKVVREVAYEEIEKIKPQVKEQIVAFLQKKNSPLLKKLAEAMIDGLSGSMANKYHTTISIEAK